MAGMLESLDMKLDRISKPFYRRSGSYKYASFSKEQAKYGHSWFIMVIMTWFHRGHFGRICGVPGKQYH